MKLRFLIQIAICLRFLLPVHVQMANEHFWFSQPVLETTTNQMSINHSTHSRFFRMPDRPETN